MYWDTKYILFTGAGFTANFGAPLARDMWGLIFNHYAIQSQPHIKDLLKRNFDFESVYFNIIEGDYDPKEKEAMAKAINDAYEQLDEIVRKWIFKTDSQYPTNYNNIKNLIINLIAKKNSKGFFFTINQDLFFERRPMTEYFALPGLEHLRHRFHGHTKKQIDKAVLPTNDWIEKEKRKILSRKALYIKLHGSQDWLSSKGNNVMVLGGGKKDQIKKEPLLAHYFETFTEVVFERNRKILVIGYGFRDDHINEILSKAVEAFDLEIFVISPQNQDEFFNHLKKKKHGTLLERGISGYYPTTLKEMFFGENDPSFYYNLLRQQFFELDPIK